MIALTRPHWISTSRPPYTNWLWTKTKTGIGGPNFIRLPEEACGRPDDATAKGQPPFWPTWNKTVMNPFSRCPATVIATIQGWSGTRSVVDELLFIT